MKIYSGLEKGLNRAIGILESFLGARGKLVIDSKINLPFILIIIGCIVFTSLPTIFGLGVYLLTTSILSAMGIGFLLIDIVLICLLIFFLYNIQILFASTGVLAILILLGL